MMMTAETVPEIKPRPATADPRGQSPLFYLAISKMVIMNLVTLGLFQVYWMYKHWIAIKYYEGLHIRPMWRVMFGFIWIFPLAFKMTRICGVHGVRKPPIPLVLFAIAYVMVAFMSFSPVDIGPPLIVFAAIIGVQIPFQLTANRVAKHAKPDIVSPRYSGLDKTALGFGILLLALLLSGLFLELPDQ